MNKIALNIAMFATVICVTACNDEWDSHYNDQHPLASKLSIMQAIEQNPDLSHFASLVKKIDCSDYLDGDQVFTVFAPVNSSLSLLQVDSLEQLYLQEKNKKVKRNDNKVVKYFVQNHIAMYNQPAIEDGDTVKMNMLNGKYGYLANGSVNGVPCISQNELYRNGLLFTISGKIPYEANVVEYFAMTSELDSVANFYARYNKYVFDPYNSVPGELVDGKTVYLDSVMLLNNVMFDELGYINHEDSSYWMCAPTNEQWRSLYNEYSSYFNFDNTIPKRDSLMDIMTCKAILGGAVFNMNMQTSPTDSVISTFYNKNNYQYYKALRPFDAGGIFSKATASEASNGKVLISDTWNIDKRTTFFQPIKIEAEDFYYQDSLAKCKEPVSVVSVPVDYESYGKVSGATFIQLEPKNTAVAPLIRYTLPGLLSNIGYDIYAVFVPAIAADTLAKDTLPVKVKFAISYNDQEGKRVMDERFVNPANGTFVYETTPMEIDTILVAGDFKVPTCSYSLSTPQVRFTIESDRSSLKKYSRTLRLDCILLKPHEEVEPIQ